MQPILGTEAGHELIWTTSDAADPEVRHLYFGLGHFCTYRADDVKSRNMLVGCDSDSGKAAEGRPWVRAAQTGAETGGGARKRRRRRVTDLGAGRPPEAAALRRRAPDAVLRANSGGGATEGAG